MPPYFFDENQVRYHLAQTRSGTGLNWIVIPGGPGSDSSYLMTLISVLDIPGNVWLIDMPGNGSNTASQDYDHWFHLFLPIVTRFENPILVGHSFGGMFPLLFPELERHLTGLVILHGAPSLWHAEAIQHAQRYALPDISAEIHAFTLSPSKETFYQLVDASIPYYFPKESQERGRALWHSIAVQYEAGMWWQQKVISLPYDAKWIPQQVPTLIIGGEYDHAAPFSLYERDERFKRPNIHQHLIKGAGHNSWIERPKEVHRLFQAFCELLEEKE